jgi:hypothetical protein
MKTLHILIVEDEPLVAMGLEIMVSRLPSWSKNLSRPQRRFYTTSSTLLFWMSM